MSTEDSARTDQEVQPEEEAVPTTVSEIRNRSQRTVTSPYSGNVYLIRDYAPVDALRLQRLPTILRDDGTEKERPEELTEDDKVQNRLKFSEAVIEACCLVPRITYERDEVGEDTLHVSEIAADIYWLSEEIVQKWAEAQQGKLTGSQKEASTESPS